MPRVRPGRGGEAPPPYPVVMTARGISWGMRSRLRELQMRCAACTFASVCDPPRAMGMMWSMLGARLSR